MATPEERRALAADLGILVLRVGASAFMLKHGWSKVERWDVLLTDFADPIGVGPAVGLAFAVFAEVVCSLLLVFGALTRLAAVPPLVTMLVAGLVVHANDLWARQELPLLFAQVYLALVLLGPGRFSLDAVMHAKRRYLSRCGAAASRAPSAPCTRRCSGSTDAARGA